MELDALLERLEQRNRAFSSLFMDLKTEGVWSEFQDLLKSTANEEWRNVYLTSAALTHYLAEQKQDYVMIGGTAVFARLFQQFGSQALRAWRGSKDIDIAAQDSLEDYLKNAFADVQLFEEFMGGIKRYHIRGDRMTSFDPIEYEPINFTVICDIWEIEKTKSYLSEAELRALTGAHDVLAFGPMLHVRSPTLDGQLALKLAIEAPRDKDIQDVFNLLGVAERNGISLLLPHNKLQLYEQELTKKPIVLLTPPSQEYLRRISE